MADNDTQALWLEFRRTKSKTVRDRLILTYAPLVKYVAGRLGSGLPAHVDEGDLVSYGLLGLMGAIERFARAAIQGRRDSNPRPTVLETAALPTELRPWVRRIVALGFSPLGRALPVPALCAWIEPSIASHRGGTQQRRTCKRSTN